jgi:hypothetical protein
MHKEQYSLYRVCSYSSKNVYTNSRSSGEISAFEVPTAATYLAYSLTQKKGVVFSSETLVNYHTTRLYIPGDSTLQNECN